jgi:hypothetical protein
MLDASDGRMKQCNHVTSDGLCAAYGAWCGDAEMRRADGAPPCMLDSSDGRMKQCNHVTSDGLCAAYGAWCSAP